MADYEFKEWVDGETIHASQINKWERGIWDAHDKIARLANDPGNGDGGGDPTPGGDTARVVAFPSPLSTWTVTHDLGRYPASVTVLLQSGEEVDADVTMSPSQIAVSFPTPTAGTLVFI